MPSKKPSKNASAKSPKDLPVRKADAAKVKGGRASLGQEQ